MVPVLLDQQGEHQSDSQLASAVHYVDQGNYGDYSVNVKRRPSAFLALLVYLAAVFPSAAGAAILCVGVDGHIALESAYGSSYRGVSQNYDLGSEHIDQSGGLDSHHVAPCSDVRLRFLQGHRGNRSAALAPTALQHSSLISENAKPIGVPSNLELTRYYDDWSGGSTTLRCLRTVKLLN